jgi:glucan biosynthesis protein C
MHPTGSQIGTADAGAPGDRPRLESLDAARATFVLMGLAYHAALPYRTGGRPVLETPEPSALLTGLAEMVHAFRMPGFFLIAGLLTALVARRVPPATFVARRLRRLGLPLVVTLLTLNVAELWLRTHAAASACAPAGRCPGADLPWLNVGHLWFLIVLIGCTLVFVGVRPVLERVVATAARHAGPFLRHPLAPAATLLALAASAAGVEWLSWRLPGPESVARFGLGTTLLGAPSGTFYFFAGVVAAGVPPVIGWLERPPRIATTIALGALGVAALVAREMLDAPATRIATVARLAAGNLATVLLLVAAIQVSTALQRRAPAIVRYCADRAYGVYVVHHLITIALVFALAPLSAPPLLKFSVVLPTTAALSFGAVAGFRYVRRGLTTARIFPTPT